MGVQRVATVEDVQLKLQRMVNLRDAMRELAYHCEDATRPVPHGVPSDLVELEREIEEYADYWSLDYDA